MISMIDNRRLESERYEGLLHIFRLGATYYTNSNSKRKITPQDVMKLSWDEAGSGGRKMTMKEAKQLLGSKFKPDAK